jgi:hypothetical protein
MIRLMYITHHNINAQEIVFQKELIKSFLTVISHHSSKQKENYHF